MAYLSLYRKWRPRSFADVIGQSHVVRTLRNALRSGRIAHAYLFCGPRGVGKTSLARLLAKGLNCEKGPTDNPCEECNSCERIDKGVSLDVIEIDGASNRGIDEVRELREKVKFTPTEGQFKVYIIDEVHMLTTDAFNALLKTLEEPPEHVVFVFATTEPHKLPATIVSRCQRFDFKRFTEQEIVDHLAHVARKEDVDVAREALVVMARHAAGGMRDALGLLDQCLAFGSGKITAEAVGEVLGVVSWDQLLKFLMAIIQKETVSALQIIQEAHRGGKDLHQFTVDFLDLGRDLLLIKAGAREVASELAASDAGKMEELSAEVDAAELLRVIDVFSRAQKEMKWSTQSKLPLEIAAIRVTKHIGLEREEEMRPVASENNSDQPEAMAEDGLKAEMRGRLLQLESELTELRQELRRLQAVSDAPAGAGRSDTDDDLSAAAGVTVGSTIPEGRQAAAPTSREKDAKPDGSSQNGADQLALDEVKNRWDEVLETLRSQRKVTTAALLREGRPAVLEGRRLVIAFPEDKGFHKASLENNDNKGPVEQVLSGMFRQPLEIECQFETGVTLPEQPSPGSEEAVAREEPDPQGGAEEQKVSDHRGDEDCGAEDPVVKAAIDLFDGKIDLS